MNKAKLLDIVASYENDSQLIDIDGENVYEPVRYENNKKQPNNVESMQHVVWMLGEIKKLADDEENHDKIMRWLGFIQGALWQLGVYSILDVRNHNRSKAVTNE